MRGVKSTERVCFIFIAPNRWLANGGNGSRRKLTLSESEAPSLSSSLSSGPTLSRSRVLLRTFRVRPASSHAVMCNEVPTQFVQRSYRATQLYRPPQYHPHPAAGRPTGPAPASSGTLERWEQEQTLGTLGKRSEHTLGTHSNEFTSLLMTPFLLPPPASSFLLPLAAPHTRPFHVLFNLGQAGPRLWTPDIDFQTPHLPVLHPMLETPTPAHSQLNHRETRLNFKITYSPIE